ncbi:uncharacterized protein LOC117192988 [Drosophila miranda]|uniref:uncharacterized protein LOC117192988 n=1 Tax=Drosophila miranda TaxID=7229 RepID=UPI00143F5A81|nr:uncharacterized protein LOC117192988 [Drosophila miranda]
MDFSSLDPHTAHTEDTASVMEDPVRLFHGRVRIVWEHGLHALRSKLMVTVLGKGEQCKDASRHQCLRIGDEPILCISKELACDGIRHCPYSNEYDSDEDYEMCLKQRRPGAGNLPAGLESDLFEQFGKVLTVREQEPAVASPAATRLERASTRTSPNTGPGDT